MLEVAVDDEQVRLRVSETAPREALALHVRNAGPRQVLAGFRQGLQASRENPLLRQFGEQRLTPIRRGPGLARAHGWQALRPAQPRCSRRVLLVRAPIGVGAARDREDTRHRHSDQPPGGLGQRVLLVSNNNIAVDTALHEALRILPPGRHGQAIRVGNIVLPALAASDQVRLDLFVESRRDSRSA